MQYTTLECYHTQKIVKKSAKLLCKHVEFTVHPRILDTNVPNASELTRLGFSDVNTALANTIEALENISAKENLQKDMMNEIFGIREEISTMKKKLRSKQKQIPKKSPQNSHLHLLHK